MFKIEEINPSLLGFNKYEFDANLYYVKILVESDEYDGKITDETISWVINHPPIFAAKVDEKMEKIMRESAENYAKKRPESIKLVQLIKNELFDFLCTKSKEYQKERLQINGNINVLIKSLAAAIATTLGGIELGIVISIIVAFFHVISKMGKNIACKYLQSE